MPYTTLEEYTADLETRGGLPAGFRVSTVRFGFRPRERAADQPYPMNLSLIATDHPTESFAAVYTRNAFPGWPVVVGRERLRERALRGVIVNTKVANVGAAGGLAAIERVLGALAAEAGGRPEEYLPASTGIIGWELPVTEMTAAVPDLVRGLGRGSIVPIARAIMTTDSYPKVRSVSVGGGRVVGIAKGAGMIEPDMATMLCFILTDCAVDRSVLRRILGDVVDRTFNRVSVDGDQSTSDMVLALSTGATGPVDPRALESAIETVARDLSEDVVRNGEGVGHVLRVRVTSAPDTALARGAAKAVVNSPLVKTAIYGNDPNVGRLVSSVGDYLGGRGMTLDRSRVTFRLAGETVFAGGAFTLDPAREVRLAAALRAASMPTEGKHWPPHERCVEIEVDLGSGAEEATVLGADLSYDYVRENADYRS